MKLCFAALIKVLRYCSKPKVYNKTLCGAIVKSIDEYYGGILESDDGAVSRLMSCDNNLSPENVVIPARTADVAHVSNSITKYVLPLLDENKIKLAIAALQGITLSDEIDCEASIGRMKYSELLTKVVFNPADFIGDIFLYTASAAENKSGKGTIGQITNEYICSFEQNTANITINETVVVEMEELGCTLDDSDFCTIFREVEHPETLALSNKSKLNLYYLDISDSTFDYEAISEYLMDCASMYVYNRTQIKDFEDRNKVRSMGVKALRMMQENGQPDERGTGNELGEMLLFTFMEGALHAPKLLSKVEIVTAGRQYNSKSDSVHLLKRKVNGAINYQLVFGASCIKGDIQSCIDNAFSVLADIKNGRRNERHMVDSTLLNRTYDDETTARLRQILIPNRDRSMAPDMAFGVFVGYTLDIECDDNDAFREEAVTKMRDDIKRIAPYIVQRANELRLGMHSFYFYFLPLNNAEEDKRQIMSNLLGGAHNE